MRIIVVRHYKTLLNASRQVLGWGDAPPVYNWEIDLAYVDGMLRKQKIAIDTVHSSKLERAHQTAKYYATHHGVEHVESTPQLNEINYGPALFKKDKVWVASHIPQHKKDPDFVYPEGESFRQMQKRSARYIHALSTTRNSTVMIVVHAGVIRGLVCHFLDLDYAPNLKRKISHRYIGDFLINDGICTGYNELGKASGFIKDRVIATPWSQREHFTEEHGHQDPTDPEHDLDFTIPGT